MGNHERPAAARHSKGEKTLLDFRVVWIIKGIGQRVTKDRGSLLKAHAMLLQVGGGLVRVPFEEHLWSLTK